MRRSGRLLAILTMLGGCTAQHTAEDILAMPHCGSDPHTTSLTINGQDIDRLDEADASERISAALGGHHPEVRLAGSSDMPYRCMSGIISALQRSGVSRITFMSEPDQVQK